MAAGRRAVESYSFVLIKQKLLKFLCSKVQRHRWNSHAQVCNTHTHLYTPTRTQALTHAHIICIRTDAIQVIHPYPIIRPCHKVVYIRPQVGKGSVKYIIFNGLPRSPRHPLCTVPFPSSTGHSTLYIICILQPLTLV